MIRSDPWYNKIAFGKAGILGSFPYHPAYWFVATLDINSIGATVEDSMLHCEGKKLGCHVVLKFL